MSNSAGLTQKLSIVSKPSESSKSGVFVNYETNKEDSYICYIDSAGNEVRKIKYSKNSIQKPVYKSELYQKLKQYRWLLNKNLYLDNNEVVNVASTSYFPLEPVCSINRGAIDGFPTIAQDNIKDLEDAWENLLSSLPDFDKEILENMMKTNEVYLLNNSKGSIDFLETQNICSLISCESDLYTDTLDLKKLLNKKSIKNDTTLKVDLSIQYSKKEIINDAPIYSFDITFSGIEVLDNNILFKDFISEQNDIRVEYLNGIIQLFPTSDNIIECIISNCSVTYGKNR